MPPPPAGASGRAIASLVLGILSLVLCGFFTSVPAAILGKMELNAIGRGESPAAGRGIAMAGFWIGIVVSVLSCLVSIGIGVAAIVAGASSTTPYNPNAF
jgi:hypothetical protein